jgi:predicted nucleic acid-binding protein
MRVVVSNTGPILHLGEAKLLNLLELTGNLHIPQRVEAELIALEPAWQRPSWIAMHFLSGAAATDALAWQQAGLLDPGEAEAIALARELKTDWFLTDDAAARLLAQNLGLEVHGSLGVVLWAAAVNHLDYTEALNALDGLAKTSLWLSPRVLTAAHSALDRLLPK